MNVQSKFRVQASAAAAVLLLATAVGAQQTTRTSPTTPPPPPTAPAAKTAPAPVPVAMPTAKATPTAPVAPTQPETHAPTRSGGGQDASTPNASSGFSTAQGGGGPGQGAAGGYAAPAPFQCSPTYTKTNQYWPSPGQKSAYYECESATIVQCPDKSAVRHPYGGSPAAGMGIEVKAVPVGQVGDYNRYKIQYKCNYYWAAG